MTAAARRSAKAWAAGITARLTTAGYTVTRDSGHGALETLEVAIPKTYKGTVMINIYDSLARARSEAAKFAPLIKQYPLGVNVSWVGTRVYAAAIEEPGQLPLQALSNLERTAEGR